jgi:hypothetical protein
MPLEFESLSHGRIAFGFFNIETDMILLVRTGASHIPPHRRAQEAQKESTSPIREAHPVDEELHHYFISAQDFCRYVAQAAKENHPPYPTVWEVYLIERGSDIGNLMGAIYGIDFRGFIGEVYKLFPFPKHREDFKQKPEGFKNRTLIEALIQHFAKRVQIPFAVDQRDDKIGIGEYLFNRATFQELVKYVWSGGFPRWKDEVQPDYVLKMKDSIAQSKNPLFIGLTLT